ncbi:MAG: hypothetical protein R3268_04535 [Acidiferrobacterales bacterium]|nr:hypothetical protein [Acidiferrobacterales bacterium]
MKAIALALLMLSAPIWAASRTHVLIVSGIGGEPVYSERFRQWSARMVETAESRLEIPREQIVYLSEGLEATTPLAAGRSTKAEVARVLSRVAQASRTGDLVFVLLIGHGSIRGEEALLNVPGPDISGSELDAMLRPLAGRRLVVINGAPSSAPFIRTLSGPDRIIITATASAAERYHTLFTEHFVAAFEGAGADTDRNGRVSMLEAFDYARREVQRSYARDGRLQTEHALLDDNGDGKGSLDAGHNGGDGALARVLYLQAPVKLVIGTGGTETLTRLRKERAAIEQRIEALKTRKAELETVAYENQLEALLIELAFKHRAIRKAARSP